MAANISASPGVGRWVTTFLEKPPCCIAMLKDGPRAEFAVGTYNLVKHETGREVSDDTSADNNGRPQQRDGSIVLCGFDDGTETLTTASTDVPFGVLHLAICPAELHPPSWGNGEQILSAASSRGSIEMLVWEPPKHNALGCVTLHTSLQVGEPDHVITQLKWHPSRPRVLGFTSATGAVGLLTLPNVLFPTARRTHFGYDAGMSPCKDLRMLTQTVFKHSLEAWTLAFPSPLAPDSFSDNNDTSQQAVKADGVWSGSDSGMLAWSSLSDGSIENAEVPPAWTDRRTHGAGVTAVLPVRIGPNGKMILITGSYDDRIRVLSVPEGGLEMQRRSQLLAEQDLGGGVWRFKILGVRQEGDTLINFYSNERFSSKYIASRDSVIRIRLLVCCMYAGAKVVDVIWKSEEDSWNFQVVAEFTEHKSMCYGCEAWGTVTKIATCSFYDRRVCVWRIDATEN